MYSKTETEKVDGESNDERKPCRAFERLSRMEKVFSLMVNRNANSYPVRK